MSPAPRLRHQRILGELHRQIANFCSAKPARSSWRRSDVRLPEWPGEPDAAIDTVVQPDLVVVCDPGKLDEAGVRGGPDLVIEILSPATASRDQVLKRDLYLRHGVREYWLVDPAGPSFRIFLNQGGSFVLQETLVSAVASRLRARVAAILTRPLFPGRDPLSPEERLKLAEDNRAQAHRLQHHLARWLLQARAATSWSCR